MHLPKTIRVSDGHQSSCEELRAWSEQLEPLCKELDDPLAAMWTLAKTAGDQGLSPSAAVNAMSRLSSPRPSDLGLSIMMLSSAFKAKLEETASWRPEGDRTRLLLEWLVSGAEALLNPSVVEEVLDDKLSFEDHERLYVRASIFGHHLVKHDQTIEQALRACVTSMVLARQLAKDVPPQCKDHPAVPYPLTVVELMLHSQGLDGPALQIGR